MTSAGGGADHVPGSAALGAPAASAVTITVAAYASRYQTIVRVPAQAPTGTLFDQLGGPVGVTQVAKLLLLDGTPIPPESTLEEVGIGDGTSILVLSVYDTQPDGPAGVADDRWSATPQRHQLDGWLAETDDTSPPPELPPTPVRPPADDPMWGARAAELTGQPETSAVPASAGDPPPSAGGSTASPVPGEPAAADDAHATGAPTTGPDDTAALDGAAAGSGLPAVADHTASSVAETPAAADHPPAANAWRRVVSAGTIAVAIALGCGVLIGRTTAPSTSGPSTAVLAAARQAATTWMAAASYPPATVAPGASPSDGRAGRLTGTTRTVGWATRGAETDVWLIVSRPQKGPIGLTVRLVGSKLAAAPTVSPLPFGAGEVPPRAPGAPSKPSATPPVIARWARATFGESGELTTSLDVGLTGEPQVLSVSPAGSGALLYRVSMHLSSAAPGTPARLATVALARDQARVEALQKTVAAAHTKAAGAQAAASRDGSTLATAGEAVTNDSTAVNQANAANAAASQALAQANAANATTPPPSPPPNVAAAQAAATSAGQTLAAAQAQLGEARAQLTADQAQQKSDQAAAAADQAKLSAAESSLSKAVAARKAAQARIPESVSVVGTYDVWVAGDRIKGWVPAGFEGV